MALSTENHVCIHGHFYQPPRENPFTGLVQVQPSAAPYLNWNERINAEAYAANASARMLGEDGATLREVNTYEWISFDFGPTLLSWLEAHAAGTYRAILEADRRSIDRYGGHGSAIAQSYNHTILPLANRRDRITQIRWGLADFEHRFGRRAEGMWLPETAVDLMTLELLADEEIGFTILAPHQAAAVLGEDGRWEDVTGGRVDPRVPYRIELTSDKAITVFFYNGALSQEIAFGGLLQDGRALATALVKGLGAPHGWPALSHVATDGETYGHHHRHGEMALATAIAELDGRPDVALTNYGEFLSNHPPERDARIIVEATSWSCDHGVERWRSDCGCSTKEHPGWNQRWRGPLRDALDWLRDTVAPDFSRIGGELLVEPWEARDAYIEVLLGKPADEFLDEHGVPGLDEEGRRMALGLLELQHRAMLMYTSCGWFFDDISGLETVFILRQTGRLIDLARGLADADLEPEFLSRLELAQSNHAGITGRTVYETEVSPYMTTRPS